MKLSDYVFDYIKKAGVDDVFLIIGGACAHLVDSVGKRKDMRYICPQHEQAGAMAAEAYARLHKSNLGVMMATSGPGATNLITGICCAWFDSIPVLYITGQVNRHESKGESKIRQVGFQETDIVDMVKGITKYAVKVDDPTKIRWHLDKALALARSGRPGPVLLDIPMDIQHVDIDPKKLSSYKEIPEDDRKDLSDLDKKIEEAIKLISASKRPVILLGGGIRLSKTVEKAMELVDSLKIPVVTSWSGFDVIPYNHPRLVGQFGVYGSRGANFAIQNADLFLSLGSRLDTRQTGGKPSTFARDAKKIVVDIDKDEIGKRRGLTPDVSINANLTDFFAKFNKKITSKKKELENTDWTSWVSKTQEWKEKYPSVLPKYFKEKGKLNAYAFMKTLSDETPKGATIIPDCGGNLVFTMQSWEIKTGQRLFSAMGNSPMGYSFPAAIGASVAIGDKPVIAIIGDGGFQMNIQELETALYYKLPVKIFIINNHGYGIIKQFQEELFNGRLEASGKGYGIPDFIKIAKAYGIKTESITKVGHMKSKINKILKEKGPTLIDVVIQDEQRLVPKTLFGNPIEDLSPLLPRDEFKANMIIDPLSK